ncbi:MAG: hypothetical protein R3E95_17960 [Thiolinea sp.]
MLPISTVSYPRSAFASYATANRADVMERAQGMQTVAPHLEVFLDGWSSCAPGRTG